MNDTTHHDAMVRDFFIWIGQPDRHDAAMLLEQLEFPRTDDLAMAVARRLHSHRPHSIKQPLAPVEALSLAVALINGGLIDPRLQPTDPDAIGEAVELMSTSRVRGVYKTRQAAVFAAVRQLGGAARFGVEPCVESELGSRTRNASEATIESVELIAEANHGWSVRSVYRVGFVLYRTNDN